MTDKIDGKDNDNKNDAEVKTDGTATAESPVPKAESSPAPPISSVTRRFIFGYPPFKVWRCFFYALMVYDSSHMFLGPCALFYVPIRCFTFYSSARIAIDVSISLHVRSPLLLILFVFILVFFSRRRSRFALAFVLLLLFLVWWLRAFQAAVSRTTPCRTTTPNGYTT